MFPVVRAFRDQQNKIREGMESSSHPRILASSHPRYVTLLPLTEALTEAGADRGGWQIAPVKTGRV